MFIPIPGATGEFVTANIPFTENWDATPDTPSSMSGTYIWTPYIGANRWQVLSHKLRLNGVASDPTAQGGRLDADLGTSDYRVTCQIPTFAHVGSGLLVTSVTARMQGDSSLTFFALDLIASAGSYSLALIEFLAPNQNTIDTVSISAPAAGSTLAIQVMGSNPTTIWGFYNGVRYFNKARNSIPTGRYAGIQGVANGVGNNVEMDNFSLSVPLLGMRRRATFSPLVGVA